MSQPLASRAPTGAAAARGLQSRTGLGIACALGNGLLLAINDTFAKLTVETLPLGQFMVLRGTLATLLILGFLVATRQLHLLRLGTWRGMALYAVCMVASTHLFLQSIHAMPLGDATAISFAAPIFTTAAAALLLGEQVGWRRWSAVSVGFLGVIVLLWPSGQDYSLLVAMMPLAVAVFVSVRDIVSRRLSVANASVAILFWNTLAVTLSGPLRLPFEGAWVMPATPELLYMAGAAFTIAGAQYLIVESYRLAELSLIMPFRYVSLLFAALAGFLVWGDVPTWNVAAGAVIISCSGLFILQRERKKALAP